MQKYVCPICALPCISWVASVFSGGKCSQCRVNLPYHKFTNVHQINLLGRIKSLCPAAESSKEAQRCSKLCFMSVQKQTNNQRQQNAASKNHHRFNLYSLVEGADFNSIVASFSKRKRPPSYCCYTREESSRRPPNHNTCQGRS